MKNHISVQLLAAALLVTTAVSLSACGGEKTPDGESATDTAPSTADVTTPATETEAPVEVTVSILLKDQKGTPISGATLIITAAGESASEEAEPLTLTTAADGTASATLIVGNYSVNVENLPAYHLCGTVGITVAEDGEPVLIEVTNNTPDGSEAHPFFINEDTTTIAFPADTTYHFSMFGGDRRSLVIINPDVEVIVGETTHKPDENGRIEIPLDVDNLQSHFAYAVKSTKAQDVTITIESEPGSSDNPITIEGNTETTAVIPKDTILYHTYTAVSNGILTLTCTDPLNNISMTNRRTSETTNFTNGAVDPITLTVKAGDTVTITVSSLGADEGTNTHTVIFTISESAS